MLQYATVKEQMSGNPNFRGCCAWKNILGDVLTQLINYVLQFTFESCAKLLNLDCTVMNYN